MTTRSVTQAEFARMQGWDRAQVTRLKQAGRLVMTDDRSRVLVDESLERIEATKPRNERPDVAERHAQARDEAENKAGAEDLDPSDDGSGYSKSELVLRKAMATMRLEEFKAEKAQIELQALAGELVSQADVRRAFSGQWTQLRIAMDHLRDQVSAELSAETDQDVIHAILGDHFERLQTELCNKIESAGVKQ